MQDITAEATIGIAVPGSISPQTGLMQNANSTWLNERPFDRDLATALGEPDGNVLAKENLWFAVTNLPIGAH
jgi:predicted NBD/HSP70 family sugar kinase